MTRFRRGLAAGSAVALAMTAQTGIAAAAPATPVSCGTVITKSTTLTSNVGPCAGDGIIIGADRVKLNLNGYKVFGATTATGIASGQFKGVVFRNVSDSEVSNGEVTGFATGVRIDGGAGNRVRDIFAHDNIGPSNSGDNGDGISVWNSNNNMIERNKVVRNGPYSGIALVTGLPPYGPNDPAIIITGNQIRDNQVLDNNVAPCTSAGTPALPGCQPRDPNTGAPTPPRVPMGALTTGGNDDGIRIEGPNATNSQVERNVVNNSGNNGIFVQPSCRNAFGPAPTSGIRCQGEVGNIGTLIKDNQADHNGYGRGIGSGINLFAMMYTPTIPSIPGKQAMVVGNTARFNYTDGIELGSVCEVANGPVDCASNNNDILRNNASDNRRNGITLAGGSSNNRVNQNTVNTNGKVGIELRIVVDDHVTPPVPVPGSGAYNNILFSNQGTGNVVFDGADQTPGCDNNDWENNQFVTVNQPCVLDSGTRPAFRPAADGNGNGYGSGIGGMKADQPGGRGNG